MKNRRAFLLSLAAGFMALCVIMAPVIADELFGIITKVDADAKKITVVEKGTDKEIEVTITDDTEFVTPKGSSKVGVLEKLSKGVAKAQEKGKKGIPAKVTHEKGVASKISAAFKKKEAPKTDQ